MAKIYTIGFSGKKFDDLVSVLDAVGVRCLIDIRLWRMARYVLWASGNNLERTLGVRYKYMPMLAPTKELLSDYKNGLIDWAGYQHIFNGILAQRHVQDLFSESDLDGVCLLCTEKTATQCHRRLVAEYLANHFPNTTIMHL